ncbi:hypothetical protein D3C83_281450 [compost metagenome]
MPVEVRVLSAALQWETQKALNVKAFFIVFWQLDSPCVRIVVVPLIYTYSKKKRLR